jgi:uncharacterized membrane-anchored protein YjiN (DUF445 family)
MKTNVKINIPSLEKPIKLIGYIGTLLNKLSNDALLINSFNEKVKVLLESIEKRKMLGNALFEQVKKYDKKIILEKFYLSILSW